MLILLGEEVGDGKGKGREYGFWNGSRKLKNVKHLVRGNHLVNGFW